MVSEASAVTGSVFGAAGALVEGRAKADALDRAAEIERNNAALDIQTGEANAALSAIKSNKQIGSISAAYGANGISSDSISALSVLAASTSNAELDRQNIMHGAKVRAINYENQATMDEIGAKSALQGSYLNAISSVMMGGSKAFGQGSGDSPGHYSPSRGNAGAGDYGSAGKAEGGGGYASTGGGGYGTAGGSYEEAMAFV